MAAPRSPRRKHADRYCRQARHYRWRQPPHRTRHRTGLRGGRGRVSICARGAEALAATRDEIARHGGVAHAAVCDLSDAGAIPRYIAEAADALGGIDILVNNASGFGTTDDEAGWAASISVDLLATVRATRAALLHLEKSEAGVILNISSISGFRASVRTPPYGAVKAAILEYTLTQAAALARKRIRVNCIAPGSIEFPGGTWARAKANNPDLYGRILRSIPFGRLGRPEEVAHSPCSCARRSPAGLPAKTSPSMAGRSSSEGKCSLGGLVHAYIRRSRRAHARRPRRGRRYPGIENVRWAVLYAERQHGRCRIDARSPRPRRQRPTVAGIGATRRKAHGNGGTTNGRLRPRRSCA